MTTFAISHGLPGLVRLLVVAAITAGWVHSPMSWSSDGRWLSYTVVSEPGHEAREPGWIFDSRREGASGPADAAMEPTTTPDAHRTLYRIWASQADGEASALIEESAWPLTAPAWSPRGRALAFGRFMPDAAADTEPGGVPRGRFEVVVQERLNRRRTVLVVPEMELNDVARERFAHCGPAWSPDGQFLVIPRPGALPLLLVMRVDTGRVVREVIRAILPAWSPDGSKLAYLHVDDGNEYSLHVLEHPGQTFTARAVLPVGGVAAPFFWDEDSRSIIGLTERAGPRSPSLELVSVRVATSEELRLLPIAPEILRRGGTIRGVAMDYCRDEDQCFIALDLDAHESSVLWTNPRERQFNKPIDPLDRSLKVGSVAVAPDGRVVALRFGVPGREGLSPPLIYDPVSEHSVLLVPDESARRQWISLLVHATRAMLASALPPAMVDGQAVVRPTLLPLPGEIVEDRRRRLARMAGRGSELCKGAPGRDPAGDEVRTSAVDREDRLYFDYLRGDYEAAMAELDALGPGLASAGRRFAILSLRAQTLWGQGEIDRAREVAAYLVETAGGPVHRVEETPLGRTLTPEADSGHPWARYLSDRASQPPAPAPPGLDLSGQERDDLPVNPFAPPDAPDFPPMIRGRVQPPGLPFAPEIPRQFVHER